MDEEYVSEVLSELLEEYKNLPLEAQKEIGSASPADVRNIMSIYVRRIDALKIEISKYEDFEYTLKMKSDYGCPEDGDNWEKLLKEDVEKYNHRMKNFLCRTFGWSAESPEMKIATRFEKSGDSIFYSIDPEYTTGYKVEVSLIDGSTRHCGFGNGCFWTDLEY